jgi:hypothetical protein
VAALIPGRTPTANPVTVDLHAGLEQMGDALVHVDHRQMVERTESSTDVASV